MAAGGWMVGGVVLLNTTSPRRITNRCYFTSQYSKQYGGGTVTCMHCLISMLNATDMRIKYCQTAHDDFVIWRVKPRHSAF